MKESTMVKNWEASVISSYLQANNLASQFHVLCWDAQSCLTLCDPVNCSPPGFSGKKLMGFFHQEYMEWGAIFSSRGSSRPQRWNSFILCHLHCWAGFLPLAPPGRPSQFHGCQQKTWEQDAWIGDEGFYSPHKSKQHEFTMTQAPLPFKSHVGDRVA